MATMLGGRYEAINAVGVGGQAVVLRAFDHRHERVVALKVRPVANEGDRLMALAEAKAMLTVGAHRNLALIRDDFFCGSDHVIVMEHVDGEDLRQRLARCGEPGLPARDVRRWLGHVAAALDHMHEAGLVHGDVKPANIVVRDGPPDLAVLVDFGGAAGGSSTTPRYAAPEAAGGNVTPAADVFSLAATAYTLLTGSPAEPGAARAGAALRRGLATDPAERFASASALIAATFAGRRPESPQAGMMSNAWAPRLASRTVMPD